MVANGNGTVGETGTHERFIHATRAAVVERALDVATVDAGEAERILHAKLVYGIGDGTYRGVCHYDAWVNGVGKVAVVEIAATAEESWVQLAGTTVHELGHVLAGWEGGHGPAWKAAAERLGLRRPMAAGQRYSLSQLAPRIRETVYRMADELDDGSPAFRTSGLGVRIPGVPRPCSAGTGTRGGTSRGKGSGSRLRLWECGCTPKPVKVRAATDALDATCNVCGTAFVKVER
jgi:hypothetical protein